MTNQQQSVPVRTSSAPPGEKRGEGLPEQGSGPMGFSGYKPGQPFNPRGVPNNAHPSAYGRREHMPNTQHPQPYMQHPQNMDRGHMNTPSRGAPARGVPGSGFNPAFGGQYYNPAQQGGAHMTQSNAVPNGAVNRSRNVAHDRAGGQGDNGSGSGAIDTNAPTSSPELGPQGGQTRGEGFVPPPQPTQGPHWQRQGQQVPMNQYNAYGGHPQPRGNPNARPSPQYAPMPQGARSTVQQYGSMGPDGRVGNVAQTQRAPSASAAPFVPGASSQKREKRVLMIVDPKTGKPIDASAK